jgi:hypothetical protein
MAHGGERGRRQVEQVLDLLAGDDGVAFLVDVTGDSVVRGNTMITRAATELIASATLHEDDVARSVTVHVDGRPTQLFEITRPLRHGSVLGVLSTGRSHRVARRIERAARVIGPALRSSVGPPIVGPSGDGGSGAPALLGLCTRRRSD